MEQNPVLFLQKNTEHWDVTLPPEVSNEVTNFIILYFFVDSNISPKILTKLYFVTGISFHSVNKLVADMPQQMT